MTQVNEVVMPEELKEIFDVPSHKMVNRHVHKLIQVAIPLSSYFFFLLSLNTD